LIVFRVVAIKPKIDLQYLWRELTHNIITCLLFVVVSASYGGSFLPCKKNISKFRNNKSKFQDSYLEIMR